MTRTDFSKVRDILVEKNKDAVVLLNQAAGDYNAKKITEEEFEAKRKEIKGSKDNLKAIIKTDRDAKYRNMIDMVDEMDITGIGSYGVLDSLKVEEQLLLDVQKANL
ncbi:MAG: biopolymer transporter ExbD [Flavobacteriales bacterium]|nr:biopolymer transporter ExbD [Flavobacteriales bacterium]